MVKIRKHAKKCLLGVMQLEKSLRAYQGTSIRRCADAFQVPLLNTPGRLNGDGKSYSEAAVDRQLLNTAEEKVIVKWISDLDTWGFPPRVEMVTKLAQQIQ